MAYSFGAGLVKVLASIGIAEAAALAQAEKYRVQFPEAGGWLAAFEQWLVDNAPDSTTIPGTLAGIARDIYSGMTGTSPRPWRGSF